MKKIVLIFLLGWLSAAAATAQTSGRGLWCPPGALWQHIVVSGGWGLPIQILQLRTEYAGDTLIMGQSCQRLRVTYAGTTTVEHFYTRADADRVWLYVDGQFYKMFDFSARPGATWFYKGTRPTVYLCTPIELVVDSVGQQFIGGQQRRWFVAHYQQGPFIQRLGRVYEGVGAVRGYLTPITNACRPADPLYDFQALCYGTVAQPGLIVMSPQANCSALPTATAGPQREAPGFAVYPTISSGVVTVRWPAAYARATVHVFNLAGQLVRQQPLAAAAETVLQLGQLPRGLYSVSVQQAGQPPLSRRIVLQ